MYFAKCLILLALGGMVEGSAWAATPVLSCSAEPAEVVAGTAVTVAARGMDLPGGKRWTYQWTSTGGVVAGDGASVSIDTKGLGDGSHGVEGRLVDVKKMRVAASCSTNFVVGRVAAAAAVVAGGGNAAASVVDVVPSTVGCGVSRAAVNAGDPVTVTTTAAGEGLTYAYFATRGTVEGNGAKALLSTRGLAGGDIGVTCAVTDEAGRTATGKAWLVVAGPVNLHAGVSGKGGAAGVTGEGAGSGRDVVDELLSHGQTVHSRRVGRRRGRQRRRWCPCMAEGGSLPG